MPGLSMMRPPPGSCDELAADRRVPAGAVGADLSRREAIVSPTRVFTSVDLPTPEGPSSAPVTPGARYERTRVDARCRPADRDRVHRDLTSDARELRDDRFGVRLEVRLGEDDHGPRSALERERQVALEQPRVRASCPSDTAMKTTSTFAAMTCSRAASGRGIVGCAARELVRRGSTARMVDRSSCGPTATQSPTTGSSATVDVRLAQLGGILARISPSVVSTS